MQQKETLTAETLKIFESVPDLYLILSPDLHILTASDAYLAATLSVRHQIVGKYLFEAFPDNPEVPQVNTIAKLQDSLAKVLATRKPQQMAVQRYDVPRAAALGAGFEEKYWKPLNTPVLDEQGEVLYIIHKISDVTEQVKDQQHIRELNDRNAGWMQEKLQAMYMQAPVAIGIYGGKEHVIELVNPRMSELLGRPPEALIGKSLSDALPEVKGHGFEEILAGVLSSGIPFEASEVPVSLMRNGKLTPGYYNTVYHPLRNARQEIIGIIQIGTEVTEQVIARQRVEEGERQLQLITDALPVLIGYLDKEEKYRFANKAYEEWFPLKAAELLGRPVREIVGEKAYQGVKGYIDRALAGERLSFSAKMPYREDFIKYIHTSYIPDIQEGEVAGFYTLVSDVTEQAVARQQLEESEEKYRNLFETMDQGFCILEMIFDADNNPLDYRFLETNPTFQQQTGLVDAKGKTALELVPNLERHWFEIYGKVAISGEAAHFTQGSEAMGRWFEVNAFRLGGSESRKVALLFTDITQRKQMEESLKRSNAWFQLVNQATQDAIWDWDLKTQEINWNESVRTMFSYAPEEVMAEASWWYDHVHPEDRERVVQGIHEVINSGKEHWSAEYRFLTGNGGYKTVFDRGFVTHDEHGKAVRMLGAMQDITERKQAEQALKESEERLSRVIDGSNDGIWDWDFRNDRAWWNQRFIEIVGVEIPERERGLRALNKFVHPDDLHLIPEAMKGHLERGEKFEVEFRIIHPSGEIRHILSKGKMVPDEQGNASLISGTITDLTERRKADEDLRIKNEQLTRINSDLDNFIYTASHDLKAPILNIEGLVNLLNKSLRPDARGNERVKSLMEMIHTSIGRFKETIKDLAEVAKVQSNAEEEVAEIPFDAILEEVKSNIQSLFDESDATIRTDFSEVPAIYYSKKNLRSIMYNLVSNAIKYRSPERPLQIDITTSRPDDEHILLSVQDNGLGIREKDQAKVFMMFKRLHQHVEGTGIGMAIVKKIIDNSSGKIELESKEGKGSLFKIYFKA